MEVAKHEGSLEYPVPGALDRSHNRDLKKLNLYTKDIIAASSDDEQHLQTDTNQGSYQDSEYGIAFGLHSKSISNSSIQQRKQNQQACGTPKTAVDDDLSDLDDENSIDPGEEIYQCSYLGCMKLTNADQHLCHDHKVLRPEISQMHISNELKRQRDTIIDESHDDTIIACHPDVCVHV